MVNPITKIVDSKVISFFNKDTKECTVVSVEPIEQPTVERPVCGKPLYPAVLVPDSGITQVIKKDKGFKEVLKTITSSSTHYKEAVPLNVEIKKIGSQTNKYVVVLDVKGKKEQKVYTFQADSGEVVHYATTIVPEQVVSKRVIQTVVDNKKVTVTNSVKDIQVFYPETKKVVEVLKEEIKDIKKVQSVVVVAESKTKDITFVTEGKTSKEVIVKEFSSTDSDVTKVDEQTVEICEVSRPKPIICLPVAPTVVFEIPVLETQIKKVLKTSKITKEQIKEVTVSKNTNVEVYKVRTVDSKGKEVFIELVHNPVTERCGVVDVSEGKPVQPVSTVTEIKSVSGVTETITTNT